RGEREPVVELGDLVQRLGGVLGHEQHAVGELDGGQRAAPGDALAGEVRPVLHQLLGRDVERGAHAWVSSPPGRGATGPSGRTIRAPTTWSASAPSVASSRRRTPSAVATHTTGKIRRVRSGPPVAESSSAASYSACRQSRTA